MRQVILAEMHEKEKSLINDTLNGGGNIFYY